MICARVTYADHRDIVELDEKGRLEVDDPAEVNILSFCSFDFANDRNYEQHEGYYLVNMKNMQPMPQLWSLRFSRVIVQGLDDVLTYSPIVSAVKARLWCDNWFVCPERSWSEDHFTLYGSCYDMADMCSGEIHANGISYLRASWMIGVDLHGSATIFERDFPDHSDITSLAEINPQHVQYYTREHFQDINHQTVWEYLGVAPPPWATRSKNPHTAV